MDNDPHWIWKAEAAKKEIGTRISGRRLELKLSQRQLAERVGTSQTRIHLMEKGEANLTLDTLQRLAEALGLDLEVDLVNPPENEEAVPPGVGRGRAARDRDLGISYSKFAVGTRPYCAWDPDLAERNLEYLKSLDPTYFDYIAEIHGGRLGSDDGNTQRHAAVAIRFAYHHSLETLFALLLAALQAPDCVVGWMQRYDISSLRDLVRLVDKARHPFLKVKPRPYTWEGIAAIIIPAHTDHDETVARDQELFGGLWRRLSKEFLDQNQIDEYNSIKHGLRSGTRAAGFHMAIGAEETPGEPALPERMHSLGGSEFGSSFFMARGFGIRPSKPKRSDPHFGVRRHQLNWDPQALCVALGLISCSVHNVVTFLRAINDDDRSSLEIRRPRSDEAFWAPWERPPGVRFSNFDAIVFEEEIRRFSPQEILAVYDQRPEDTSGDR